MTGHVVPAGTNGLTLIKCYRCKALYSTDQPPRRSLSGSLNVYEPCPVCGCSVNDYENVISLWRYNLIRWLRGRKCDE